MSRVATTHPVIGAFVEACMTPPLNVGPLEPSYVAAVAEEARSHNDVADDRDIATDETLHEPRDRRSERERLMDELGLSERDFF